MNNGSSHPSDPDVQPSTHQSNFRRRNNNNNARCANKKKKKPRQRARNTNASSHSVTHGDECAPNADPHELLIGVCNVQALPTPSDLTIRQHFLMSAHPHQRLQPQVWGTNLNFGHWFIMASLFSTCSTCVLRYYITAQQVPRR